MTESREFVEKKVRECWPDQADDVMAILDQCRDSYFADESREALRDYVDLAKQDYRDVLALAEYPGEMRAGHLARSRLSPHQRRDLERIRKQDREQYLKWLKKA